MYITIIKEISQVTSVIGYHQPIWALIIYMKKLRVSDWLKTGAFFM